MNKNTFNKENESMNNHEPQCPYTHEGKYWLCVFNEGHEGSHAATREYRGLNGELNEREKP